MYLLYAFQRLEGSTDLANVHTCTAPLRLLLDKSKEVQSVVVKTLCVLLSATKQELGMDIADCFGRINLGYNQIGL
jgi:hypothetical protein